MKLFSTHNKSETKNGLDGPMRDGHVQNSRGLPKNDRGNQVKQDIQPSRATASGVLSKGSELNAEQSQGGNSAKQSQRVGNYRTIRDNDWSSEEVQLLRSLGLSRWNGQRNCMDWKSLMKDWSDLANQGSVRPRKDNALKKVWQSHKSEWLEGQSKSDHQAETSPMSSEHAKGGDKPKPSAETVTPQVQSPEPLSSESDTEEFPQIRVILSDFDSEIEEEHSATATVAKSATCDRNSTNREDSDKPSGEPGPDEGDPSTLFDPEEIIVDPQFLRHWLSCFKKALKSHIREPIRRWERCERELWVWCNFLVAKYNYFDIYGRTPLSRVNAAVYASGATISWWLKNQRGPLIKVAAARNAAEETEMKRLRRYIGFITCELQRRETGVKRTERQERNFRELVRRYGARCRNQLLSRLENLKVRLLILKQKRDVRVTERERKRVRKGPLHLVLRDQEQVESSASKPDPKEHRRFWSKLVGKPARYTETGFLRRWEAEMDSKIQPMDHFFDEEDWTRVLSKARPWKAPGPDGILNILWKRLRYANDRLFKWCQASEDKRMKIPKFLTQGRVVLLPKSGEASDPANYRPIACLNTCYKLITGLITAGLNRHVNEYEILPKEQRALVRNSYGCEHALTLDQTIAADARIYKRPLSVAWIDFRKAFDMVSHALIKRVMSAIKVPPHLKTLLEDMMSRWCVCYETRSGREIIRSSFLEVRRGVLQGDTLSPLLFCLVTSIMSSALNSSVPKYTTSMEDGETGERLSLNHLYYMDDLKVLTTSSESYARAIEIVKDVAQSSCMELNFKKCAAAHFNQGKATKPTDGNIPVLGVGQVYKYLGMPQHIELSPTGFEDITARIESKCRKIFGSDLTFGQMVRAYNAVVTPIVRYVSACTIVGGGKFSSQRKRAKDLDEYVIRLLRDYKLKVKTTNASRVHLSPTLGGYGLQSLVETVEIGVCYAYAYVQTRPDLRVSRALFMQMRKDKLRTVFMDMKHVLQKWGLEDVVDDSVPGVVTVDNTEYGNSTLAARAIVELIRTKRQAKLRGAWAKNETAAAVLASEHNLDLSHSFKWLEKGSLSARIVRDVLAVQEAQLWCGANPGNKKSSICRRCHAGIETAQHIATECPTFRQTLALRRHNDVAKNIHFRLCQEYDFPRYHYSQDVPSVLENESVKLLWDQNVVTHRKLKSYKPDILLVDHKAKRTWVIEVAVTWFTRIKEMRKIKTAKYMANSELSFAELRKETENDSLPAGHSLAGELERLYGYQVTMVPVIIGACGEVGKDLVSDLMQLPLKEQKGLVERLERSAVIGTGCIVRAHLNCE